MKLALIFSSRLCGGSVSQIRPTCAIVLIMQLPPVSLSTCKFRLWRLSLQKTAFGDIIRKHETCNHSLVHQTIVMKKIYLLKVLNGKAIVKKYFGVNSSNFQALFGGRGEGNFIMQCSIFGTQDSSGVCTGSNLPRINFQQQTYLFQAKTISRDTIITGRRVYSHCVTYNSLNSEYIVDTETRPKF